LDGFVLGEVEFELLLGLLLLPLEFAGLDVPPLGLLDGGVVPGADPVVLGVPCDDDPVWLGDALFGLVLGAAPVVLGGALLDVVGAFGFDAVTLFPLRL
jgi:hypothetical protein